MPYPLFSFGKDKTVIVGTTSQLVLPENNNRVYARLTNNSDEVIFLGIGVHASLNEQFRLEPSGSTVGDNHWEINNTNRFIGNIYAICASGNKRLLIVESATEGSSSLSSSSSSFCSSSSSSSSFSSSSSSFSSSSSSFSSNSTSSSSFSSSSSSNSSSCSSSSSYSSSSSSESTE